MTTLIPLADRVVVQPLKEDEMSPGGIFIPETAQPRPVRGIHRAEGWTPHTIAEHAIPALRPNFFPLDASRDVFNWDPV